MSKQDDKIPFARSADVEKPLYEVGPQFTRSKFLQIGFILLTTTMILINLILSFVRAAQVPSNRGVYILMGLSLLGFVFIELVLIVFIRKGDIPPTKTFFIYLFGAGLLIESIFSDILLYI